MSTPLYSIYVDKRDGLDLTISVSSYHPDQSLPNPANPTFFWLILFDNVGGSPLKESVGELHFQEDWIAMQPSAYIAGVTLLEIGDYPPQSEEEVSQEESVYPWAVYRVTVLHPDWIAHLNRGDLWETTAYSVPPSRQVTSIGKPWKELFEDLLERYGKEKGKKLQVSAEVLQQLIDALDCEDDDIAYAAVRWLIAVEGAEAALPRLLQAIDDRDSMIRWMAFDALLELKDPRAVPSLICSLRHCPEGEHWGCHETNLSALRVLASLGSEAALARDAIERCLVGPDRKQRQMSLLALYRMTGEEAYFDRFLLLYQEEPVPRYFPWTLAEPLPASALPRLLPFLLEDLEKLSLEDLLNDFDEPILPMLRHFGPLAVVALPALQRLAVQQDAYRQEYPEEEISYVLAVLEQTMAALSTAEKSD